MVTDQKQKQEVLGLFQQAIAFAQAQKHRTLKQHLEDARQHLQEGKLVVVCGEFNQGKSSFLNALLNEPQSHPEDLQFD
ncbi:MAG: hypothetical protein AB4426_08655 [Xenococcaceae cyanobacterium]